MSDQTERFTVKAWDTSLKRMFYPEGITIFDLVATVKECGDDWWFDPAEDILLQLTGRRDCTGKLIFEGDILEFGNSLGEDEQLEVRYDTTFILYRSNRKYFSPLNAIKTSTLEIIGNIYENPDLLKA